MVACTTGHFSLIAEFLKYKVSLNVKDEVGDTALHHAAQIQEQRYSKQRERRKGKNSREKRKTLSWSCPSYCLFLTPRRKGKIEEGREKLI